MQDLSKANIQQGFMAVRAVYEENRFHIPEENERIRKGIVVVANASINDIPVKEGDIVKFSKHVGEYDPDFDVFWIRIDQIHVLFEK